ncbi:hypothetical protein BCR32DRAFT_296954 [Anaeromyces robustus]|uniref:Uncharacterized protein n=1 Tax=Anaeromyces robustus TaxID=1754192 RepID=A0A1Y1WQ13_9FUNG|nr:hypothetical protein BCR32DRAFT_296954 [Anaeromyces robustus]|eukprot:ORX75346.1 hypothetical protein BCR32DRAFT_296954 [Anaeromyces robustus]
MICNNNSNNIKISKKRKMEKVLIPYPSPLKTPKKAKLLIENDDNNHHEDLYYHQEHYSLYNNNHYNDQITPLKSPIPFSTNTLIYENETNPTNNTNNKNINIFESPLINYNIRKQCQVLQFPKKTVSNNNINHNNSKLLTTTTTADNNTILNIKNFNILSSNNKKGIKEKRKQTARENINKKELKKIEKKDQFTPDEFPSMKKKNEKTIKEFYINSNLLNHDYPIKIEEKIDKTVYSVKIPGVYLYIINNFIVQISIAYSRKTINKNNKNNN